MKRSHTHICPSCSEPHGCQIVHELNDVIAERDELRQILKIAACPDKACLDGTITHHEGGGIVEVEPCQFCNERERLVK